jgi:ABC-type glycerol-3-phosphate transport system substrate-binding protein
MPIPNGWHNVIGYFPYLWGDAKDLDISAESFIKVIRQKSFLDGLYSLAKWYKIGTPAPTNDADMFFLGKIGIALTQVAIPFDFGTIMQRYKNFRFYPIPAAHGTTPNLSSLGGFSVGIFKGGVHSEDELQAAWKWLKFLFQKRAQYPLSFNYDMPTRIDAPAHLNDLPESLCKAITETIQTARPQFDFKNIRSALGIFGDELLLCLQGKITPEQCQDNTLRQIQRWLLS